MSYPLDLDEMAETKLVQEIERRKKARAAGLCDYCGRAPDTSTCKFPDRHRATEKPKEICPECGQIYYSQGPHIVCACK